MARDRYWDETSLCLNLRWGVGVRPQRADNKVAETICRGMSSSGPRRDYPCMCQVQRREHSRRWQAPELKLGFKLVRVRLYYRIEIAVVLTSPIRAYYAGLIEYRLFCLVYCPGVAEPYVRQYRQMHLQNKKRSRGWAGAFSVGLPLESSASGGLSLLLSAPIGGSASLDTSAVLQCSAT